MNFLSNIFSKTDDKKEGFNENESPKSPNPKRMV